jgi:hypothetical protein
MSASDHLGQQFHGTPSELQPGDMIEPGKHPRSHNPYGQDLPPRDHVYLSSRRAYVTEHYGPNVYQVEPTGPVTRDPEYKSPKMLRSEHPLRVVKKVSANWGEPAYGTARQPHRTWKVPGTHTPQGMERPRSLCTTPDMECTR